VSKIKRNTDRAVARHQLSQARVAHARAILVNLTREHRDITAQQQRYLESLEVLKLSDGLLLAAHWTRWAQREQEQSELARALDQQQSRYRRLQKIEEICRDRLNHARQSQRRQADER
jgi:microsomal dipeptidase-like Zn-dependent dipeptidase